MNLLFTDKLLRDIENISKMELRDWNDLARDVEINIKKLKMMLHLQVTLRIYKISMIWKF